MTRLVPTIGLEIHCRLATRTKLFSRCPFVFGAEPNTLTDPYTLGLPGTLPAPNERAVRLAVRLAVALGCTVATRSRFARKHYVYPDLPKGYQITQADEPYATGGAIPYEDPDAPGTVTRVGLARIHLEEDAGKSIHDRDRDRALVDYNRAGTPLVEIVTRPGIRSARHAAACFRAVRAIVRTLGISDANMEQGSLRCDANVSLAPEGAARLGTRCEIKNVNSFRYLELAIAAEIRRQEDLLARGKPVVQATVGYDEGRDRVFVMRTKETAADYRYVPDPDLPPLEIPGDWIEGERAAVPELPAERTARLIGAGVPRDLAVALAETPALARLCDAVVARGIDEPLAAKWIAGEIGPLLVRGGGEATVPAALRPDRVATILGWVATRRRPAAVARTVLGLVAERDEDPEAVVATEGLEGASADAIAATAAALVAEHPEQAAAYRAGNEKILGWFMGRAMRTLRGSDPAAVRAALEAALAGGEDRS